MLAEMQVRRLAFDLASLEQRCARWMQTAVLDELLDCAVALVGQSSTVKPGTRWNSRRFRVSSVMPRERAWAAMNKSWLPMGVSCTSASGPAWMTALPDRPAKRQNGVG
jgi:hypothetical protein